MKRVMALLAFVIVVPTKAPLKAIRRLAFRLEHRASIGMKDRAGRQATGLHTAGRAGVVAGSAEHV